MRPSFNTHTHKRNLYCFKRKAVRKTAEFIFKTFGGQTFYRRKRCKTEALTSLKYKTLLHQDKRGPRY